MTYAQFYRRAAKRLGLRTELVDTYILDIFHKKDSIRFVSAVCSKNNSAAASISRHKYTTNSLLKKNGLPVFEQNIFSHEERRKIRTFVQKIKFPVVVKPSDSFQGDGITANINSYAAVDRAVELALRYSRRIIIEKNYHGNDYRILLAGGKLLAVTLRLPARVIGDGQRTIEELIVSANNTLPKKIIIDQEIRNRLLEQDVTLHTIPEKEEIIDLRYRANAALGGTTINLDPQTVHPDNLRVCKEAVEILGLELAGVDLMSSDITKSYKQTKAGITEINDNPAVEIHQYAQYPIHDIAEQVLAALFRKPYIPIAKKKK